MLPEGKLWGFNDTSQIVFHRSTNVGSYLFLYLISDSLTFSRTMELRRAADALLRSNASPLTTFLTPSNLVRQPLQCQFLSKRNATSLGRSFATSSCKYAPQSPLPTTTSPQSEPPSEPESFPSSPKPQSNNLAQGLWGNQPSRKAPVTPVRRPNSAATMFQNLNRRAPVTMDLSRMIDPVDPKETSTQSPEERALLASLDSFQSDSLSAPSATPKPPPLRLNPSTGRTFAVGGNVDVARAFVLLNQSCGQNKVRADQSQQRFHERGGLKRKRLRRQRWRMRFGEGFKATVLRVKQLRNQGW